MKLVFENATIADVIKKAAKVAPDRGYAFDKAAGIVFYLDEENEQVSVMATNLEIFYTEIVDAVEMEGSGYWRFPSSIIGGVLGKLPIGSGRTVTIEGDKREVTVSSGKTKAKVRCIGYEGFPTWEPFDPDTLQTVSELGARIQQVSWAAANDANAIISGVHLDGEKVMATDRFRMACIPCEAEPIYKPITIPSGTLKSIMTELKDCAIGVEEGMFLIMPSVSTQIKTVIYGEEYPNIERAMLRDQPESAIFNKTELLEIIDRAMVFSGHERDPELTIIIGKGELAVMMSDADQGFLGDTIDIEGAGHKREYFKFTPRNLTDPLNAVPQEQVIIHYFIGEEKIKKPIRITTGDGFEAWVSPRREAKEG